MKKILSHILLVALSSCILTHASYAQMGKETLENKKITAIKSFFPRVDGSFIGDPMPNYDEGEFNVFYLNDIRGGGDLGVHAIHLLSSNDLYDYKNHSEVIPYINDVDDPELLIGTGSIIKVGDTWHAWYTAHNQNVFPVESVMHATSKDKLSWTKHPEDTLLPGKNYRGNDFRDPHVVWIPERQEYWMLITTRSNGRGIIARYSSKDLKHWQDQGIFFDNDTIAPDSNLECPTLVYFNGRWYLTFSDQWPLRLTQYRVADKPEGPWHKLDDFAVDSAGFYAGKMTLKDDRLFMFGWVPTKSGNSDKGNIDWAGNLVVHELIAEKNGQLKSVIPQEIEAKIAESQSDIQTLKSIKTVESDFSFGQLKSDIYAPLPDKGVITGTVALPSDGMIISFGVNAGNPGLAYPNLVFNKKKNKIYFFNTELNGINKSKAESWIDIPLGDKVDLKVIYENSIAVFYIDNRKAFTTRMYNMPGKPWSVSLPAGDSIQSSFTLKKMP
ncbi:glycoside hydrolase family 32 protein [Klebsiella sp. BIGb0407]|uniref:glycoside hydrolase family 32 protein n=1 Tax=Klebsiella sp. BIGb0407 TaxID=2940603 RepID=UPI00216A01A0|nr:glycoside hydrolase family 32 protein [Klebsiella sp. BIGb0407]MCS3432548.1 beta-fructofuranosidase [Klebsiella sp. BIGb0407]